MSNEAKPPDTTALDLLVKRLRERRMLATNGMISGVGRTHAQVMWITGEGDPDCSAAADAIEALAQVLAEVKEENEWPGAVDLPDALAARIDSVLGLSPQSHLPKVESFWLRCVNARCVVIPVPAYSQYSADGDTHAEHFIGIRYAALPFDEQAVGPDYWFMLEERQSGAAKLYESPEAALEAHETPPPGQIMAHTIPPP